MAPAEEEYQGGIVAPSEKLDGGNNGPKEPREEGDGIVVDQVAPQDKTEDESDDPWMRTYAEIRAGVDALGALLPRGENGSAVDADKHAERLVELVERLRSELTSAMEVA